MSSHITIIIPIFNEELIIQKNLQYLKLINSICSIVFVDGNSTDASKQILKENGFNVITSPLIGRGAQLSYVASKVGNECEILLFLHIDTKLPEDFNLLITNALKNSVWGRFDVELDCDNPIFKLIQFMVNLRAKVTGIVTGDQTIFVRKSMFIPYSNDVSTHSLMEDIFLSKVLKKNYGRAFIIKSPVITSARYWINHGVTKTILRMWWYRLLFWLGVSPQKLYNMYYK